ncbi:MAG: mechanosensitive ion channel [Candidatus Rifleibacteriota bacterium]
MKPDMVKSAELIFQDFHSISFLYIAFIIAGAFVLTYLVKRLLPLLAEKFPPRFRYYFLPVAPILSLFIMVAALLLILPIVIRPSLQNVVAIFGTIGLALGFAFKDFASSLIAGIITIFEQPYRVGDRVTINGIYGEVIAINLRSLRLVTPDDTVVTIPHNKIWNESILNSNDGNREQMCVADFYVLPGHDASRVRSLLRDVALASPYTLFRRPVKVQVMERPWGTRYRIKAYPVDGRDEFAYISDLTVKGRAALTRLGVRFANVQPAVAE